MRAVRSFPRAAVALVVALMVAVSAAVPLTPSAADPSESQVRDQATAIQQQLTAAHTRLNDLYVQAGVAGEAYNAAVIAAQKAQKKAADLQLQADHAAALSKQSRASLAAITVQEFQTGGQAAAWHSMLSSAAPGTLLERGTLYAATQDALDSKAQSYAATNTVATVTQRRAAEAASAQQTAVEQQQTAKQAVDDAVTTAQQQEKTLTAQRTQLLTELAAIRQKTLEEERARQAELDRQADEAAARKAAEQAAAQQAAQRAAESTPAPSPTPTPSATSDQSQTSTPTPKPSSSSPSSSSPSSSSNSDGSSDDGDSDDSPSTNTGGGSKAAEKAIGFAMAQLGKPYVWGASGPDSYDCSGLTMRALAAAGVSVPHQSGQQYAALPSVSISSIRRGDLVFWSSGGTIYHVAIYLGGGKIIQAPRTGLDVEVSDIDSWIAPNLAARPF